MILMKKPENDLKKIRQIPKKAEIFFLNENLNERGRRNLPAVRVEK
jgi:hypothetical protein